MIDATYFRSNYKCIYGEGCKGVLDDDATDLQQGCCSYGAHFEGKKDLATVVKSSKRLTKKNWQNKDKAKDGPKDQRWEEALNKLANSVLL